MPSDATTSDPRRCAVSVVIPALNAEGTIGRQLRALAGQRDAPRFEVVVADNGSTDATVSVVRRFDAGPVPVRAVDASDRPGASHARNRGALAARAEVLLFCDADDVVADDWIATLHRAVVESGGAIVAGDLAVGGNPADVVAGYRLATPSDAATVDAGPARPVVPAQAFAGYLPTVCSANFAVARRTYLAAGGMDESYRGGCEETDFSWRAQQGGAPLVYCPSATVEYTLRDRGRTVFRQQRRYQRERILLWMRFRERGMRGPSARVSLRSVLAEVVRAPLWSRTRSGRLAHCWSLGGHLGALEGMLTYRLRGRVPEPVLLPPADAGATEPAGSPD